MRFYSVALKLLEYLVPGTGRAERRPKPYWRGADVVSVAALNTILYVVLE